MASRLGSERGAIGIAVVLGHDDIDERWNADVSRAGRVRARKNRVGDRADERELGVGQPVGGRSGRDRAHAATASCGRSASAVAAPNARRTSRRCIDHLAWTTQQFEREWVNFRVNESGLLAPVWSDEIQV
jgi:hypothetical protein